MAVAQARRRLQDVAAASGTTLVAALDFDNFFSFDFQSRFEFLFKNLFLHPFREFPGFRDERWDPLILKLGSDLPKRPTPYERGDVENAICEVHPTIEVVAGHLIDWPNQDVWSVIADNGTDGALIYGAGCKLWRELDLVQSQVSLTVNGKCERTGYGANVLGDPLDALVWLANARSRDGDGLIAGDIHNTGTATDIYWASSGDQIVADFQSLGKVSLRLS